MNDKTVAIEFADWLAYLQKIDSELIARNDPTIRVHIAKFAKWEKMVRELAK